MLHCSCDRCHRIIDTETEIRYIIKLQAHASVEGPGSSSLDDDPTYLSELQGIVENLHESGDLSSPEEIYHQNRFDLCEACYHDYLTDPLGTAQRMGIDCSRN